MANGARRYRFVLVEEPGTTLPVRYRRSARPRPLLVPWPDPREALFEALLKLSFRGEGGTPWAPVLSDDPLAFLLDAVGDAVILWREDGAAAYANPAARRLGLVEWRPATALEELAVGGNRFERRCLTFELGPRRLVLEVLRKQG